MIKQLGET